MDKYLKLLPTALLKCLVHRNLQLRKKGKLPDEWYWADVELMRRGSYINA